MPDPKPGPIINPNSGWFNWTSNQMVHFLLGLTITQNLVLFGYPRAATITIPVFGALKEFGWDIIMEHASVDNGVVDYFFYILGWIAAFTICQFLIR